jgi:hypothetical protein
MKATTLPRSDVRDEHVLASAEVAGAAYACGPDVWVGDTDNAVNKCPGRA